MFVGTLQGLTVFVGTGFDSASGLRVPAGRILSGDATGDDGDDQDLGAAEARVSACLHGHVRQPGQHVPPVPPPQPSLALL